MGIEGTKGEKEGVIGTILMELGDYRELEGLYKGQTLTKNNYCTELMGLYRDLLGSIGNYGQLT